MENKLDLYKRRMKNTKTVIIAGITLILVVLGAFLYYKMAIQNRRQVSIISSVSINSEESLTPSTMKISSNAFENNAQIPSKYTCDAENINPPLMISDIPADAKTLALLVDDPDAPVGDWVHWIAWNIPPTTTEITENSAPLGIQGTTDFGKPGWGGPCPPFGTHRYFFKIYALNTELNLPASAKKADLLKAIEGHILDQAELIGLYQRQ